MTRTTISTLLLILAAGATPAPAQVPVADPAQLAFEEGRWAEALEIYRSIVIDNPGDGVSRLRLAQSERELGRYDNALATLEQARLADAPETMIELERARNLAALGRQDEALAALEIADHVGLRALTVLADAHELEPLRAHQRFQYVARNVRARVYPCESMPDARQFDFWLGRWEVRHVDGTLVGHTTVSRRDGGCSLLEQWQGAGGASGSSVSFYSPSMEQWRQIWVGSAGTLIDISGGWVDGAMRMQGTIEYAAQNQVLAFRGAWFVNDDGVVRQHMEEYDAAAQSWRTWFDGLFRRAD